LHHLRRNNLPLLHQSVRTLVVDEADLVLSFGYTNDISEIIRTGIPQTCQRFLMSATLTPELSSLKTIMLNSPIVLKLEEEDEDENDNQYKKNDRFRLKQFYLLLPKNDKYLVLYVFLKLGLLKGKGLFFVNTTDGAYRMKLLLEQFHIRSAVLNPELPFRSRMNIIDEYNIGNFDYLVATDSSADAPDIDEGEDQEEDADADEGNNIIEMDHVPGTTRKRKQDTEYGVARGLDFRDVSFVVNVDMPPNPRSYSHRVGRTARGKSCGVALTLVVHDSNEQLEILNRIQAQQPRIPIADAATDKLQSVINTNNAIQLSGNATTTDNMQPQPTPLDFDLREIEGFRYRVEDVSRAVTRVAIRETRAAELRAEILNSERLRNHFDENPADLQLLRHDRIATHVAKVQEHLKHVPKYLLPQGMQVANLNRKRKRKKNKHGRTDGKRRLDNDPLHTVNVVTGDGDEADPLAAFLDDDGDNDDNNDVEHNDIETKKTKVEGDSKVFANTRDRTGHSTAGRNEWKARHRKGRFSNKPRQSQTRTKAPLGI
jgi:ATP-dependent RNA helicase DDX56/DBP9